MKLPFDLSEVKPAVAGRSDKYSWNLYRWLRKQSKDRWWPHIGVYRPPATEPCRRLIVGYRPPSEGGWIYGSYMNSVLCSGTKEIYAFAPPTLLATYDDITAEFWADYLRIGRCIFDPNHTWGMIGDEARFSSLSPSKRRCNWCGATMHRHTRREVKTVETWSLVHEAAA